MSNGKRVSLTINMGIEVEVPGEVFSPVGLEDVRMRSLCEGVRDRLFSRVYGAEERVCGAVNGAVQAITTEQVLFNVPADEKDDRRIVLFSGLSTARCTYSDVIDGSRIDQIDFGRYALGKAIEEKGGIAGLVERIDEVLRENIRAEDYRAVIGQVKELLSAVEPK